MATKCRYCGSTSYGHSCIYSPRQDAPARPRRQQVHLVRFDVQRLQLHLLPDSPSREVTGQGQAMSRFETARPAAFKAVFPVAHLAALH